MKIKVFNSKTDFTKEEILKKEGSLSAFSFDKITHSQCHNSILVWKYVKFTKHFQEALVILGLKPPSADRLISIVYKKYLSVSITIFTDASTIMPFIGLILIYTILFKIKI